MVSGFFSRLPRPPLVAPLAVAVSLHVSLALVVLNSPLSPRLTQLASSDELPFELIAESELFGSGTSAREAATPGEAEPSEAEPGAAAPTAKSSSRESLHDLSTEALARDSLVVEPTQDPLMNGAADVDAHESATLDEGLTSSLGGLDAWAAMSHTTGWAAIGTAQPGSGVGLTGNGSSDRGFSGRGAPGSSAGQGSARGARLLPHSCTDLFPSSANSDVGQVTVELEVGASGLARVVRATRASTTESVFSQAAELCASRLRFTPARDEAGHPVSAHAIVRLHFARHS